MNSTLWSRAIRTSNWSTKGKVLRTLDPGMTLFATGEKTEMIWEGEDELGNKGWVSSVLFELAKSKSACLASSAQPARYGHAGQNLLTLPVPKN
jgi:hypothetical protein